MTYIALFDCVLGRCQCLRLILRCGAQDCSPELKRERRSGHNDIQVLVITRIREMVYSRPGSIHPRGSSWDVRILVGLVKVVGISRRNKKRSEFALPELWLVISRCGAVPPIVHPNGHFSTARATPFKGTSKRFVVFNPPRTFNIQSHFYSSDFIF